MTVDDLADSVRRDVLKAIEILKDLGADRVYVFGSVLSAAAGTDPGDIDIAVEGLSPTRYFEAHGRLAMHLDHEFDLVDLEDASAFVATLRRSGRLQRVA
jgi:predicted nucleotidyltransferase